MDFLKSRFLLVSPLLRDTIHMRLEMCLSLTAILTSSSLLYRKLMRMNERSWDRRCGFLFCCVKEDRHRVTVGCVEFYSYTGTRGRSLPVIYTSFFTRKINAKIHTTANIGNI